MNEDAIRNPKESYALRACIAALSIGCIPPNTLASDARSHVLMPIDTDLTELRFAYSETTTPGVQQDTKIENQTTSLKQTHYFNFIGSLGALQATVPYTKLHRTSPTEYRATGMSDSTLLLGLGLYNMPALSGDAFRQFNKNGITASAAVSATLPSGSYKEDDTLNTGSHRHSQKLEIQTGWRKDRLLLEVVGGVTRYGKNNDYRGSNTLEQKNSYYAETHFSYDVIPNLWISLDSFHIRGGEVVFNSRNMQNPQRSSSGGVTTGYRPSPNKLIKLVYQNTISSSDVSTKLKGIAVSYNHLF